MVDSHKKRVVIIGGGFGGLAAAKKLRKADAEVLLIDKRNYHLFQPLLHQVATAGLSPADIASPIRSEFEHTWFSRNNVRVMLANAQRVDREQKKILLEENHIDYDYLVVATGMKNNYFGNDQWEEHAPGLKSLEEAVDIRRRILLAFEAAEYEDDPACVAELLTFVVVGGGPTGVEMAGAIAEIAHDVMTRDFRNVDPSKTRTVLIEGQDRVLSAFSEYSSKEAQRSLEKRGVEVILNTFVEDINERGVQAGDLFIPAGNVVWAAGLKAEPITQNMDVETDGSGRAIVNADLSVADDPHVFVIGDAAHFDHDDHGLLPGVAPTAIQQGEHVAKNIMAHMAGRRMTAFEYFDKGSMATIGRHAAVAEAGPFKFRGYFAWLAWLFVHLAFLVSFKKKVSVMLQWIYSYVAFRRSTRLIVNIQETNIGQRLLRQGGDSIEGPSKLFESARANKDVLIDDIVEQELRKKRDVELDDASDSAA